MNLTSQTLHGLFMLAEVTRPILGIAAAPRVIVALRERGAIQNGTIIGGIPFLVDARVQPGQCEVFYDREAWEARCEEQRQARRPMKNDPRQWPKLSATLPHPRNPDTCQSCGLRRTLDVGLGPPLEIWREHDHQDAATPIVVILCHGCAERLIERHPRLYDRQPANKPVPGCMLHLCLDCVNRDGTACRHVDLKANGGAGLNITVPPPTRAFWDGRGKDGRRTGGLMEIWSSPASACAGRLVKAAEPIDEDDGE